MSRNLVGRMILPAAIIVGSWASATVDAGDCFRRMGVGFSAGYNAPLPCTPLTTHQALGGWAGWKGACLQMGRPAPSRCGCEMLAPCAAPSCAPCGDCRGGGPFAPFMAPTAAPGMMPRLPAPIY